MCVQQLFTLDAITALSRAAVQYKICHMRTALKYHSGAEAIEYSLWPKLHNMGGLKPNKRNTQRTRSYIKQAVVLT